MKSILIIGSGSFGRQLCRQLGNLNNEIMVIDKHEEALEDLHGIASNLLVADCTAKNVLSEIGVSNFDLCFVCVGSDFKSNLIIVTMLKDLGAQYIVSQTNDEMLEKLLLRNGADETIHPYKDSATRAAVRYSSERIADYIQLKDDYSIFEMRPLKQWIGETILKSNISRKYKVYIISIESEDGTVTLMPHPDTVIRATDMLTVLSHADTIKHLLK